MRGGNGATGQIRSVWAVAAVASGGMEQLARRRAERGGRWLCRARMDREMRDVTTPRLTSSLYRYVSDCDAVRFGINI